MAANHTSIDVNRSFTPMRLAIRNHRIVHLPEPAVDNQPVPAIKAEPAPAAAAKLEAAPFIKVEPAQAMGAETAPATKVECPANAKQPTLAAPRMNQAVAKAEGSGNNNNEYLYSIPAWNAGDSPTGSATDAALSNAVTANPNPAADPTTASSASRRTQGQLRLQQLALAAANSKKVPHPHRRKLFAPRKKAAVHAQPAAAPLDSVAGPSTNAVAPADLPAAANEAPARQVQVKIELQLQVQVNLKPEPLESKLESGVQRRTRIKFYYKDFYPVPVVNGDGKGAVRRNSIRFYRKNFFDRPRMIQD